MAWSLVLAALAVGGGCHVGTVGSVGAPTSIPQATAPTTALPPRPPVPQGPLAAGVAAELDDVTDASALVSPEGETGQRQRVAGVIGALGQAGDVRVAWVLVDLMMFEAHSELTGPIIDAVQSLMGVTLDDEVAWVGEANLLLSWDIPAPPGYLRWKRRIFTGREESWAPFFADDARIDWRQVAFSGAFRDGSIPLDHPRSVAASGGRAWPDDTVVFGVEVGNAVRAYPRPLLEEHPLVNDALGGRELVMSYCSLCLTAVPYLTGVAGSTAPLFLRESGLVLRSNNLLYDQGTESLLDQFTGEALAGPLMAAKVKLQPVDVVTTSWGQWRRAHPATTIVEPPGEDVTALAQRPSLADSRDRFGPILPIGPVDPRLPANARVLGAVRVDGQSVAFPLDALDAALAHGRQVLEAGVEVKRGADGGLRALATGRGSPPLLSRQAYWFAWSEFEPGTRLWAGH